MNKYMPLGIGCQCVNCLGCSRLDQKDFRGAYDCDNFNDCRTIEDMKNPIDKDKYYNN